MDSHAENTRRIAKNTLMLYVRMLFGMLVSLYTSRVVLNTLGVEDYGIYNVVGGVVAMMGILNGAMSTSTQRFLNFELGTGNKTRLQQIFGMSLNIYFLFAAVFVILAETVGLWFMNTHLLIPEDRMMAANYIFQFSIFATVISLISNPYNAAIVAHERMDIYAYTSIFEVFVKLGIVFLLLVIPFDKLIGYGLFLACTSCLVTLIYYIFCKRHFEECQYKFYWDRTLFQQLFSYFGWNLFGSTAGLVKTEGLNIILNMFFNPAVNAARGIACQINNVLMQFFSNFYTAVRPQIIKYYAQGEISSMLDLVFRSTRYSFFLCLLVCMPVMVEAPYLINFWLGQTPEYVIVFTRLIIVISIVDALAAPIMTAAHATGKIRLYQFVVGMISILNIPISYVILKYVVHNAVIVYAISFGLTIVAFIVRLLIVKHLIDFSISIYIRTIIMKIILLSILSAIIPISLHVILQSNFLNCVLILVVSVLSSGIFIYIIGMNRGERMAVINVIHNRFKSNGIGR